jgi:YidC/Oxa1 family membrane protein insertase
VLLIVAVLAVGVAVPKLADISLPAVGLLFLVGGLGAALLSGCGEGDSEASKNRDRMLIEIGGLRTRVEQLEKGNAAQAEDLKRLDAQLAEEKRAKDALARELDRMQARSISDKYDPDALIHLGFRFPVFNWEVIGLLPVLMGIAMFLQQRMTTVDPKQKMMTYLMPVMMVFIFMNLPAGLNLYWLINNILSIGEQYLIHVRTKPMTAE